MHGCSCYVYPPVGNFVQHSSGTIDTQRDSMFAKHWFTGQNVIPRPGDWDRQLCKMDFEKGAFDVLLDKVNFDEPSAVNWWTEMPPREPEARDKTWRWLLWRRWWIDWNGEWVGPDVSEKGRGKKHYARFVKFPSNLQNMNGDPSPISMLAQELVVDYENAWNMGVFHRQCGIGRPGGRTS